MKLVIEWLSERSDKWDENFFWKFRLKFVYVFVLGIIGELELVNNFGWCNGCEVSWEYLSW